MSEESRRWWNNKELRSSLPAIVLILAFFGLVLFYKHGRDNISPSDAYSLNIHTEVFGVALGVIITVFVIDALNRRRDAERRQQDLIDRLLREVRSPEPDVARNAFHEMRDLRLIYDENSILQRENLLSTKPVKVDLSGANLKGIGLCGSDLGDASLIHAILEYANLSNANLRNANLAMARLKNADLWCADLTDAEIFGVDFTGANLKLAKFRNASHNKWLVKIEREESERFDPNSPGNIILPDGTVAAPDADLTRFIYPDHPNFWEAKDSGSPAHPDFAKNRNPWDLINYE